MLQMTSDRVFSLGNSEVRILLILPPNARNREVITIAEQPVTEVMPVSSPTCKLPAAWDVLTVGHALSALTLTH